MNIRTLIKIVLLTIILFSSRIVFAQDVNILSLQNGEISATYNSSIERLIDNNDATDYNFTGLPNDIIFRTSGKTYTIKKILLTSSSQSANKDPKSIELSASLDGINWDLLFRVSTLNFTQRKEIKTYNYNKQQPYSYFRLRIESVALANGNACSISEWQIIGEEKELATPPSDVRAYPESFDKVTVSWRDRSDNESNFEILRSANGKDYVKIADVAANVTSYTDNSVNSKSAYMYKVCSMTNNTLRSVYSLSNSVVTPHFPALTLLTMGRRFTASDQYNTSPAGEGVTNAFDNDGTTKFLSRSAAVWLRINFNETYKAEQYSITSANDASGRDPKSWKVEGSNNGTSWTVLDEKSSQSFDLRFQKRYFSIESPGEYKHYRLSITQNNGETLTQLADWLLYADVPVGTDEIIPATPSNFQIENRVYHHVKLSWNDVANETSYLIERYVDGVEAIDHAYEVPANNTESYPYSLEPETDYTFKIYAVNGIYKSAPAVVSVTTGKKEFAEKFENYNLWILDGVPATFTKVEEIGNTAFYMIDGYTKEDVNELYYQFYAVNWEYVFQCYGQELSDPRLHVLLIPLEEGGGLASIYDYRSSGGYYQNMVYIKANKNWFKNASTSGYVYDVMAHELCHIIEGVGGGYNGSMFYPIWGDSKWAEILQYDIFTALGVSRAQSWHASYTGEGGKEPAGGADYPNNSQVSYWYRDFLYPTYDKYGKTALLKKFWKLQQEHYRMKNGNFQGSASNPGGRGNLGELIHFWSGAAGVDVKPYAIKAFGWNTQFEAWLQQAKIDYPGIKYDDAPIDNSEKNICQNGGKITSNYPVNNIQNFIDNNYSTYFNVRFAADKPLYKIVYQSAVPAKLNKYAVVVNSSTAPKSWVMYGSNNGVAWTVVDTQTTPSFVSNKAEISLTDNSLAFSYFKFAFEFPEGNQIRIAEIELHGVEYPGAPNDLAAERIDESGVLLEWSGEMDEVERYEIERSSNGVDFTKIGDTSPYSISFRDEQLTPGSYFYRVAAVNKNPEKPKVYTNTAYINTTVNSLNTVETQQNSFYDVIAKLNTYPDNTVQIYTVTGQQILKISYHTNDLLVYLQTALESGVYLVKIVTGKNDPLIVSSKFIVR